MPWVRKHIDPDPALLSCKDRYGKELCCKIIGCGPVQLKGYIKGTYEMRPQMVPAYFFLCCMYLKGLDKVQLTEIMQGEGICRELTEAEISYHKQARAKANRWDAKNQEHLKQVQKRKREEGKLWKKEEEPKLHKLGDLLSSQDSDH